jgi:ribosomal protein S18 acetylase RimI-like enzyme
MQIKPYEPQYLDAVVSLSLRAWTPVFESIQNTLDVEVYQAFYPEGWRISQQQAIEDACRDENMYIWIARLPELPEVNAVDCTVGFVAVKLDKASGIGEIYMIAVDPDFQDRGIGSALTEFALTWMKEAGMAIAMVETGSDPGHAPARHTYEKAGFGLWPVARYFKKL